MGALLVSIAAFLSSAPPTTITLPTTVITAPAPRTVKAGELTHCGAWHSLASGTGTVRTCEVSK